MDVLFNEKRMSDLIVAYPRMIKDEVANMPPERLSKSPVEDLCRHFVAKYTLDVPTLNESEIQVKPEDVQIQYRSFDDIIRAKGTRYVFFVPFTGDPDIFRFRPNSYSLNPPRAEISRSELLVAYERTDHDTEAVKKEFQSDLQSINSYLGNLRTEAAAWNATISAEAKAHIEARRQKLAKDQQAVASLGFPIREK